MKKYSVIAYADEDGYPRKECVVEANTHDEAERKAWKMFPEYHNVGVYEIGGEGDFCLTHIDFPARKAVSRNEMQK